MQLYHHRSHRRCETIAEGHFDIPTQATPTRETARTSVYWYMYTNKEILTFPICITKSTSISLSGSARLKMATNHDRTCSCTNHSRTPSGGRTTVDVAAPVFPSAAGTVAKKSLATANRSVSHQDSPATVRIQWNGRGGTR